MPEDPPKTNPSSESAEVENENPLGKEVPQVEVPQKKRGPSTSKYSAMIKPLFGGEKAPPPAPGESISLEELMASSGGKLRQSLAKLSKVPGKIKRAAFREPKYEDITTIAGKLLDDSSGCTKLRNVIGMGLQCGNLPESREGVWGAIIHLADLYLRRVDYPRPLSFSSKAGEELVRSYGSAWLKIAELATEKSSGAGSSKLLDKSREVLLLDMQMAFCSGKLSGLEFAEAAGTMLPPESFADPMAGAIPWSFPSILASCEVADQVVHQAGSLHQRFIQLEKELSEARSRISELDLTEAALRQELTETNEALDEESIALKSAQEAIVKLREDVATAGTIVMHSLDETKARMLGFLEGNLDRHLKTIQTCIDMDPPRIKVAVERVETLLKLIGKETAWLKPSE